MMETTNHDDGASFEVSNPTEAPTDIQPIDQESIAAAARHAKGVSTLGDLDKILSEFEAAQAKDAPKDQSKPQPVDPVAAALREGLNYDQVRGALRAQGDVVNRLYQEQIRQQNERDFSRITEIGNQRLKDAEIHVSEEFVQRFFAAEANLNPQLRRAFDMRYESAEHLRQYEKLADKAMYSLIKAAKKEPDQEVTADKMAVVAALKGASSSTAPPEGPVRYGDLTEAEFTAEKKKLGL